jgi:RNA polymerase sigma-70 factor (ECF subfamily)
MASHKGLSDENLVRRANDGDEGALAELVRRCRAKLHSRIQARIAPGLRRKVAASDVLQEAHLVALRQLADFEDRGDGSFERWFGKIIEYKIREAIRHHVSAEKRGVRREISSSRYGPIHGVADHGPTPSQVLAGEEMREQIRSAFERLPADQREVLVLLQEKRHTIGEAAVRLNRSVEATRKLYGRALARLEELIGLTPDGRRKPTR